MKSSPCRVLLATFEFLLVAASASAFAQDTTRASIDSTGVEGDGDSGATYSSVAISADGRIVAFASRATNFAANDNNGDWDIFVHDRTTLTTERVSNDSTGVIGNKLSWLPALSADGSIVAFASSATNLVAGDTNGFTDVFVHDRTTGVTERVSVRSSGAQANLYSFSPSLSADGRYVAFSSWASNLVAGDSNGGVDVFVHDRVTGVTERVSVSSSGVQGLGWSDLPTISANGLVVAFQSLAGNLVANDTNGKSDVFVHDRSTGVTERVSVSSNGSEGDDQSSPLSSPALSADGRFVAFDSQASNLVAGDTNGFMDVFVHDRSTGATERVSVDSSGAEGDSDSTRPTLSTDGLVVAFESVTSNLVAGDTNYSSDIFVHDRSTGVTERVSVDSSGTESSDDSHCAVITADARNVAFQSVAANLVPGDTNGFSDVFVHESCSIVASWWNYGNGFPGTNGIPAFTSRSSPVLGSSLTLDLASSSGTATAGLLFLGFQQVLIHSSFGGDLVVLPVVTLPIGIPSNGATFTGTLPHDDRLCGFSVDLQAIEADPGAAKGVSFTAGLGLLLGN